MAQYSLKKERGKLGKKSILKAMKYEVGIDEVGRGPLAGPVTVCSVQWLSDTNPEKVIGKLKDSKKLSEKKREEIHEQAEKWKHEGLINYSLCSVDAACIDKEGINQALAQAASRALGQLNNKKTISTIHADYGIPIPKKYQYTHLIKGDEQHPIIALASIIAKVTRDREMTEFAKKFNGYGFERNKGYGTKEHREAIKQKGITKIHRKTFLKNILLYTI